MTSAPLLQIMRALPTASLRALDKFVHSPYHVTHPGAVQLYAYLRSRLLPTTPEAELEAGVIASQLGESPRRLYHLNSYLLEAVEQFLALETWQQRPTEAHALVVESLRRLRLPDLSAGMLRYARKRLETDSYRGGNFHRAEYALHLEAYYLSLQQGRARAYNLQELSNAQDVAFICEKLRTGCMLLSHQAVSKQGYDKGLLDAVLRFLENHPYLQIPAVAVYYHGYFAQLGDDDDAHFQRLKTLLQEHAGRFSLAEIHDLYLMAINYCIRRINQAREQYFRDAFELYQSGLEHGALLEHGMLSRWTYNNIALTGLHLLEFEWVRKFLHDYAPLLPENHRDGAFNFNIARYYYDTGNHRQAMQHLLRMEYDDVLQNLVAKVMLCRIYYELGETDALENQLDSIQIYLRRKKILGYHQKYYTTIVRFMRKLVAINRNDSKEVAAFRQQIELTPSLPEREWLLKQL